MKTLYNALFLFYFYIFFTTYAHATETLNYNHTPSVVSIMNIDSFLESYKKGTHADYDIAAADLNGDGLMEFILRSRPCPSEVKTCTHMILAENKNKIYILGIISAHKLMLSRTFTHAIQDFLAFQSDNNDYEYERYIWSPSDAHYILEGVQ